MKKFKYNFKKKTLGYDKLITACTGILFLTAVSVAFWWITS